MALFPAPGKENPRMRIVVMVAVLSILVLMMYRWRAYAPTIDGSLPPAGEQEMVTADPEVLPENPLPELTPTETLEKENLRDFVIYDDEDWREAADLTRIRPAIRDAFAWLKSQPHSRLAEEAWPRGRWSYAKLMQQPDLWRFKIMHGYGMLLHKETLELNDMPLGLRKLHKLIIFDIRQHQRFIILTPLLPKNAVAVEGNREGSYLAFDGIFMMRYPYQAEGGRKRGPLFFCRRVYNAQEAQNLPTLLDPRGDPDSDYQEIKPLKTAEVLDTAFIENSIYAPPKDGSGTRYSRGVDFQEETANLYSDKPAITHMFEYLYGLPDEQIASRLNPEVTYATMMRGNNAPPWMRGKITSFRGMASFIRTYYWPKAEDGITRLHVIVGHDLRIGSPEFTWAVAVLNIPEGLYEDDEIECEGMFLKLYPYRSVEGMWHWAPLILCKNIRRIERDPGGFNTPWFIGIGSLLIIASIFIYWASNRDTADLDRIRGDVMSRRVERDKKQGRIVPQDQLVENAKKKDEKKGRLAENLKKFAERKKDLEIGKAGEGNDPVTEPEEPQTDVSPENGDDADEERSGESDELERS